MSEIKLGTIKLIDDAIAKRVHSPRDYMGASILGKECDRDLWYSYKKPKPVHDPRVQRIFDMGHIIEEYVVGLLREAGLSVYEKDEAGKQFGFIDGAIAGHMDGVVMGLTESTKPHLLEIKSANEKRFKDFEKKGVKKMSNEYWVQIHVYMQKFKLDKGLFVIMNKNTCELYFERVDYDKGVADVYLTRGHELVGQVEEPSRKYKSSTFFKCRFCNYNEECWADE